MNFTLLYCYHPFRRLGARSRSIDALRRIDKMYPEHVRWVPCPGPYDYAEAVAYHWNDVGSLINCEQDMGPFPETIQDLVDCPHDVCTVPYWLSPASTQLDKPIISVSPYSDSLHPLTRGIEWAARSAIGLVKFSEEMRRRYPPPDRVEYGNVEHEFHIRSGNRWHVHWPAIPHYHGFKELDYDRAESYLRSYYATRARTLQPDPA